jgi:hypothetical protein
MYMLVNKSGQDKKAVEVDLLVGAGHLSFFSDFLNFAFVNGYAAVDDLSVEDGFGIG